VTPCSRVEIYEELGVSVYPEHGVVRPSETIVNFYQTTRCHMPDDMSLHGQRCCKNSVIFVIKVLFYL